MSVRQMLIDTCLDLDLNRKAPEPRCLTMSFGISCKDSLHHCLSVPDATGYLVCKSATEQWHWHWTLPTMRCSIKERFKGKGGPFGGAKHHFADLRRRPPRLHPHQASDFRWSGLDAGHGRRKTAGLCRHKEVRCGSLVLLVTLCQREWSSWKTCTTSARTGKCRMMATRCKKSLKG